MCLVDWLSRLVGNESGTLLNDWPGEYHDSRDWMHAGGRGRHAGLAALRLLAPTNELARLKCSSGEEAAIGRGGGNSLVSRP